MADVPLARKATCPLCSKPGALNKRAKKLYGGLVCRKCYYKFTNRRQAAYIIDSVLFSIVTYIIAYDLNVMAPVGGMLAPGGSLFEIMFNVASTVIFYMKDGFGGKSPGRWLTGVTVVDAVSRRPIGFAQSFKRNLPLLIPLGAIIILVQMGKGPRMGDKWAKTRVVWDKFRHQFPFEQRGRFCARCGYDLTGNVSGICPECGEPIHTRSELSGTGGLA